MSNSLSEDQKKEIVRRLGRLEKDTVKISELLDINLSSDFLLHIGYAIGRVSLGLDLPDFQHESKKKKDEK